MDKVVDLKWWLAWIVLSTCLQWKAVHADAQMVMMGSFMEPRMNPDDPMPSQTFMSTMSPDQREMFQKNRETRRKYLSIMRSGRQGEESSPSAQDMYLQYEQGHPVLPGQDSRMYRQLFTSSESGLPPSKPELGEDETLPQSPIDGINNPTKEAGTTNAHQNSQPPRFGAFKSKEKVLPLFQALGPKSGVQPLAMGTQISRTKSSTKQEGDQQDRGKAPTSSTQASNLRDDSGSLEDLGSLDQREASWEKIQQVGSNTVQGRQNDEDVLSSLTERTIEARRMAIQRRPALLRRISEGTPQLEAMEGYGTTDPSAQLAHAAVLVPIQDLNTDVPHANEDVSPGMMYYAQPSQVYEDLEPEFSMTEPEIWQEVQDQNVQESITIDLTSNATQGETILYQNMVQLENEDPEDQPLVYYKDMDVDEEPLVYYKDFPQGTWEEEEDLPMEEGERNIGDQVNEANSQFVITTKSSGQVRLGDQLMAENPNNILEVLDLNPLEPLLIQSHDEKSPKQIKRVRKIKFDKSGHREVDLDPSQTGVDQSELFQSLDPESQLNVFEFELQGNEDANGVIQTIEIEGPVDYEFNYVVDLINSGFFSQDEAQDLQGNVQGNFQIQDGVKSQAVHYGGSDHSGFSAQSSWQLNPQ